MHPVIVDIGEFYMAPLQTGIQRTVCELLSHWPAEIPVRFVRYDPASDDFISISSKAIEFLITMFGKNILSTEQIAEEVIVLDAGHHSERVHVEQDCKILVPELFYDHNRIQFYRTAVKERRFRTFFLVYDFMPWFKPDLYGVGSNMPVFMPYLQLTLDVSHRAYISAAVRDDYKRRIAHVSHENGPAMMLGADGIGLERQVFRKERRNVVCLGTFEAKKRQDIVFDAFCTLPPDANGGKLQFLGRVPTDVPKRLQPLLNYRGTDIEVIDGPSDDDIRDCLREARASIFISPNEGFGLPALETLYCGVPTIVYRDLPSVSGLSSDGQIRLGTIDVTSVASALLRIRDDAEAEALWNAAAGLVLPAWKDFASALATWVAAG